MDQQNPLRVSYSLRFLTLKNTLNIHGFPVYGFSLPIISSCTLKTYGNLDPDPNIMLCLPRAILLALIALLLPLLSCAIIVPSTVSNLTPIRNTTALRMNTHRPPDNWQCPEFTDYQVKFSNYHEPHFSNHRARRFAFRDLNQDFQTEHDFGEKYEYSFDGIKFRMVSTVVGVDLDFYLLYATLVCLEEWIEEWGSDLRSEVLSTEISAKVVDTHEMAVGHWGG